MQRLGQLGLWGKVLAGAGYLAVAATTAVGAWLVTGAVTPEDEASRGRQAPPVAQAGRDGEPAAVLGEQYALGEFSISGGPDGTYHPGVELPVNLIITNPYNFPIQVTEVAIEVTQSDRAGCA